MFLFLLMWSGFYILGAGYFSGFNQIFFSYVNFPSNQSKKQWLISSKHLIFIISIMCNFSDMYSASLQLLFCFQCWQIVWSPVALHGPCPNHSPMPGNPCQVLPHIGTRSGICRVEQWIYCLVPNCCIQTQSCLTWAIKQHQSRNLLLLIFPIFFKNLSFPWFFPLYHSQPFPNKLS